MVNGHFKLSFQYRISENHRQTVYFAFCYPYSYCECQEKLLQCDEQYLSCNHNIYYHREILCYSLEGRRVDLITVSSCDGMTDECESRLPGLFPDTDTPRAKRFPGKKVRTLKYSEVCNVVQNCAIHSTGVHVDKSCSSRGNPF